MRELTRHPHWVRYKNLLLVLLGLWIVYSFAVHMFVTKLNKITVPLLDLPLGFYLAVQGSMVVFVVVLTWFAKKPS